MQGHGTRRKLREWWQVATMRFQCWPFGQPGKNGPLRIEEIPITSPSAIPLSREPPPG